MTNNKPPLVSIIVPVYNHQKYVSECLTSILEQDYPCIELIVINDGSTDESDTIIREYHDSHSKQFTYISKKNEGLIRTLNIGLDRSNGEYFCELASDDILLPGSIRKRVEFLGAHPDVGAVFADNYLIKDGIKTTDKFYGGYKSGTGFRSRIHGVTDLLKKKARYHIPTGMFRTEVLKGLGGFDEDFRDFEDISIRYRLPLYTNIEFMDEPVMYYRIHTGNVSKTNSLTALRENILALEKLLYIIDSPDLICFVQDKLARQYLKYLKKDKRIVTDKDEILRALKKAVSLRPRSLKVRLYHLLAPYFLK